MGQYAAFDEQISLEDQVKSLGDEELLDFWEETQQLTKLLDQEDPLESVDYNPEYERIIIQELQLRSCGRK